MKSNSLCQLFGIHRILAEGHELQHHPKELWQVWIIQCWVLLALWSIIQALSDKLITEVIVWHSLINYLRNQVQLAVGHILRHILVDDLDSFLHTTICRMVLIQIDDPGFSFFHLCARINDKFNQLIMIFIDCHLAALVESLFFGQTLVSFK